MSKSRRASGQSNTSAVPDNRRARLLRSDAGALRGGWLLAIALVLWLGAGYAIRLGLGQGMSALFRSWNVNAGNLHRAPAWARRLYVWQSSLITLIVSAAGIAISLALRRRLLTERREAPAQERWRFALRWCALGMLAVLIPAALYLLADSLRMMWPISRPRATLGGAALAALYLIVTLSEELFMRGVIFDGLRTRWGCAWAALTSTVVFFLSNGGYAGNWLCAVNVALLGALCCAVYARWGLWSAVALRWGLSFATVLLLGYGGGSYAVYRLYGVSEAMLTGGDAGPVYGLWLTLPLLMALAWLFRKHFGTLFRAKKD